MFGLVTLQVEFLGCKSRVPEEVLRRGSTAIEAHRDEDVRYVGTRPRTTPHDILSRVHPQRPWQYLNNVCGVNSNQSMMPREWLTSCCVYLQNLFAIASDALSKKILSDGKNLGRGILKVNSFVNHRVDVQLMDLCGHGKHQLQGRDMSPAGVCLTETFVVMAV